jgi:hypothetical protein
VWVLFVGPPSSGKTELLNPLDDLPGFYRPDDLTVPGLLTAGPSGTLGGVLGRVHANGGIGILVIKDFSTVLAQGQTGRVATFSILRRVYDGEVERDLGSRHGIQLRFEGKVGLLGAVTDAIDEANDEIGDLGPRMLLYWMPDIDKYLAMSTVGQNAGHQLEIRTQLADAAWVLGARCGSGA